MGYLTDHDERTMHDAPCHVVLDDGTTVVMRAASDGDRLRLREFAERLSPDTYWHYFHIGGSYSEVWADRVAALGQRGGPDTYVMAVEAEGALVGVARFDPARRSTDPAIAQSVEIGILLADAWQGRHLGRHVLSHLATEARCAGKATLMADVLWENRRMIRLARRVFPGAGITYLGAGECRLTLDLAELAAAAPCVSCPDAAIA